MTDIADMTDAVLNAAVAVEVMGWELENVPTPPGAEIPRRRWRRPSTDLNDLRPTLLEGDWSPATDIDAAFEAVELMRERQTDVRDKFIDALCRHADVDFFDPPIQAVSAAMFRLTPRAICEAALAAVRS